MKLLYHITHIIMCLIVSGLTLYISIVIPEEHAAMYVVMWFYLNIIVAACFCYNLEQIINYIKRRK